MMESRGKALSHLRKSLRAGRGEELPMQKVSVIAADEKGLEEGLEKAKQILPGIEKAMSSIKPESESEEYECKAEDCVNGNCKNCSQEKEDKMEEPSEEMSEEKMKSEDDSQYLDEKSPEDLKAMVKSLKSRLNY